MQGMIRKQAERENIAPEAAADAEVQWPDEAADTAASNTPAQRPSLPAVTSPASPARTASSEAGEQLTKQLPASSARTAKHYKVEAAQQLPKQPPVAAEHAQHAPSRLLRATAGQSPSTASLENIIAGLQQSSDLEDQPTAGTSAPAQLSKSVCEDTADGMKGGKQAVADPSDPPYKNSMHGSDASDTAEPPQATVLPDVSAWPKPRHMDDASSRNDEAASSDDDDAAGWELEAPSEGAPLSSSYESSAFDADQGPDLDPPSDEDPTDVWHTASAQEAATASDGGIRPRPVQDNLFRSLPGVPPKKRMSHQAATQEAAWAADTYGQIGPYEVQPPAAKPIIKDEEAWPRHDRAGPMEVEYQGLMRSCSPISSLSGTVRHNDAPGDVEQYTDDFESGSEDSIFGS